MGGFVRRLGGLGLSLAAPLLVLGVLLLALPAQVRAANVVVHNCTASGLRAVVVTAHDGDVVTFQCTLGNPTIVLTQTQAITHDITLDGGSAITLTGGGTDRILSIAAGHLVSVTNLALQHGHAAQGSAINVFGAVNVDNVTFFDNLGLSPNVITGGAIALHAAIATIRNSRFISNAVTSSGVIAWGGAIGGSGALTVTQTLFAANSADYGGAIFVTGDVTVIDSVFSANTANSGGAVATFGHLDLIHDEFDLNHARGLLSVWALPLIPPQSGGALSIGAGSQVDIEHGLFLSNTADSAILGRGGAIVNAGDLAVNDTLLAGNSSGKEGGALDNLSTAAVWLSSFAHNAALNDGGAISNTASLSVNQSTFFSNTTSESGGAVANAGQALIQSSQFAANDAGSAYGGGAVNNAHGTLQIRSSTFINNNALIGGALANHGLISVTNSTEANNSAQTEGSALFSGGAGTLSALLLNNTIISNTTQIGQAGVRQTGGALTLHNTLVSGNAPANCAGTMIVDGGHNLQYGDVTCGLGIAHANPQLGPLQDNGGTRVGVALVALQTSLPLPGSPALDVADIAACPARDERGFLRVAPCDIGAVERAFEAFLPLIEK